MRGGRLRERGSGVLLRRMEVQRHAVDAIAEAGRRRTIGEDVAEMAAAGGAMDFRAGHEEAAVGGRLGRAWDRVVEARPAGAALELQLALEQRRVAAGAGEGAGPLLVQQRATAGALGPVLAHDVKLLG